MPQWARGNSSEPRDCFVYDGTRKNPMPGQCVNADESLGVPALEPVCSRGVMLGATEDQD